MGEKTYDHYNLKLAGADGTEFIRAVSQDLYRDANVSAMPARGAVLEARRSRLFGGKPTMFEFVRYRVDSSDGSEREVVRTYDLSMPTWIGVFLILMSGLMVWAVGSISKAVKIEHSGPEYFNVTRSFTIRG